MGGGLTGLDPERGEPVTYGVTVSGQRGTIRLQNERYEFTFQDLSDPDFRLPGLDPMPLEPVTLESLYQNNTGPPSDQLPDVSPGGRRYSNGGAAAIRGARLHVRLRLLPVVPAIHTEAEAKWKPWLPWVQPTDKSWLCCFWKCGCF